MAWECRLLINCECSASGFRYQRRNSNPTLKALAVNEMAWPDIVVEFTRLALTVREDRLLALSGLAEARRELDAIRGSDGGEV
jgi:hypothetical protein